VPIYPLFIEIRENSFIFKKFLKLLKYTTRYIIWWLSRKKVGFWVFIATDLGIRALQRAHFLIFNGHMPVLYNR